MISKSELYYADFFKIAEAIIYGSLVIGESSVFAADYEKAKQAAINIFALIDSRPKLNNAVSYGVIGDRFEGNVQFMDVDFRYPTRLETPVLSGLSLEVKKGQTVAFVGSSGCGKSTCLQLLLKFYDTERGDLLIDGTNLRDLNTCWLRSKIGLVSQEPLLFGSSIRENIEYGDNSRRVPFNEVVEASRRAHIHKFVTSLPQGYDTPVGEKGAQLSGGQKQRIAIARALLRDPAILLLDEATAALDTESEKAVQEALDEARMGRTCLVIAHRLSTIRNADMIYVLDKGRVLEKGTHQQLLQKQGFYHQLLNSQVP
jgi:ABC-type multidrug transport system fused ATPase/permease subunit